MSEGATAPNRTNVLLSLLLGLLVFAVTLQEKIASTYRGAAGFIARHLAHTSTSRPISESAGKGQQRGKQPPFPTAIALVIAEDWLDDIGLDRVASLIRWSCEAGIKQVQVFDPPGKAKGAAEALEHRLNPLGGSAYQVKSGLEVQPSSKQAADIHRRQTGLISPAPQNGSRQSPATETTQVLLLDEWDSVKPLIAAARRGKLQDGASTGPATTQQLLAQLVEVAGQAAVQEPSLLLVFGPVLTLAGFPPWLVRHSEIYGMGSLTDAHCDSVNQALQRYCRTTQRFGT